MGKFSSDASKLLEFVGGRENIRAVSHCVTRMRFVLGDESIQIKQLYKNKYSSCTSYI